MSLQQKTKWMMKKSNVEPGQLVLIVDDQITPAQWKRGRIVETYEGEDGLVRNCKIKLPGRNRYCVRPVQKLVCLPTDEKMGADYIRFTGQL